MKKWHKVLIAVLAVLVVAVVAAVCVYQYYAKEKIEKALEKAQTVLQDENLRKEIDDFVNELVESGELDESQLEEYLEYKDAMDSETATPTPAPQVPEATQKPVTTPAPIPTPKPKTLMERVKAEMTVEEFAFAMSMYGKIDVNYCLANYYTNRNAVKNHIKSRLTGAEISRSLAIYGKYSYILK